MNGFVSLVGAGPGDPELLTLRALDRLQRAELVLVDALVPDAVLALATKAKRFFVGKRAGRHSIDQEGIHKLMILGARRGQRIVRLKCGDPFVFGRGGEEALALEEAGIAYEIVPGVSSAFAAPALAGIPVTHRSVSAGVAVLSGHATTAYEPILAGIAPNTLTLVVLMGIRTRAAIAAFLIERGWPATTPAAVVANASHPDAASWRGALVDLGNSVIHSNSPAVLVIGEVVALADQIRSGVFVPALEEKSL